MSQSLLISETIQDAGTLENALPPAMSVDVSRQVLKNTSVLSGSVFVERGAGFIANVLAARFGGASTFGAYSLAISTANNISTYAAGGIGATATRFAGKYSYDTDGYSTLAKALAIVSITSAAVAATALWFGALPLATLLHHPALANLLRWAAISSLGIILLECARGFFVGEGRVKALALLSAIVAIGMLSLLPLLASLHRPSGMVVAQGLVALSAVATCYFLARQLGLFASNSRARALPLGPMLKEIWAFGGVQLAGLIGANLAGWWLTALLVRSDATLVQMSFFAIASQWRNLAGLLPGLFTEGSYAAMAGETTDGSPQHVMAMCSYASTAVALVIACVGTVMAPLVLRLLYGSRYNDASATIALALALAVVHMGNAPAAARLSAVSIASTGMINTVWAVFLAITGTLIFLHGGTAATAMSIFLAAHVLSAALVLAMLARLDRLPAGSLPLFALSTITSVTLGYLAVLRGHNSPQSAMLTLLITAVGFSSLSALFYLGRRYKRLPPASAMLALYGSARIAVQRILNRRGGRSHV